MIRPSMVASMLAVIACSPAVGSTAGPASLASPKSRTVTPPSGPMMMLSGFTSRWAMPRLCAAERASATGIPISRIRDTDIASSDRMTSVRVRPETSSMVKKVSAPTVSKEWMVTIPGCRSAARAASRSNRADVRVHHLRRRIFRATVRPSRVSCAS